MNATTLFRWDGQNATAIANRLGLSHVELHAEVESTQDVAHALAEQGARPGTLVVADAQRGGRGRLGRSWTSLAGHGVWCTLLERPHDTSVLDVLSLRVGLYVADALDVFSIEPIGLKWPNDLMIGTGKLGGILVEARWTGQQLSWIAIGIGINVQRPPDVDDAIGLRDGVKRVDVLAAIVGAVRAAAAVTGTLSRDEMDRYRARDVLMGRRIVSPAEGIVRGAAPWGALIVETPSGTELHRTGTIRFAEES